MVEWLHSLGSPAGALWGVVLLALDAYCVGFVVLHLLGRLEWRHPVFKHVVRYTVGYSVFCWLVSIIGYWPVVRQPWITIIMVILAAGGFVALVRDGAYRLPAVRHWYGWLVAALPVLVLSFGGALAFPIGFDDLTYHIGMPVRWLASGSHQVYLDVPMSGYPNGAEMAVWAVTCVGGITAGKLLMWFNYGVIFTSLHLLLRPGRSIVQTSVFLFTVTGCTMTLMMIGQVYIEPLIGLNLLAIIMTLKGSRLKSQVSMFGLVMAVGILAGGAVGVKLTAVVMPLVAVVLMLTSRDALKRQYKYALLVLVVAGIIALPFYVRPWLYTGNPFYPYCASWFTDDPAALAVSSYYHHGGGITKFGIAGVARVFANGILLGFESGVFDGAFGLQFVAGVLVALWVAVRAVRNEQSRETIGWLISIALLYLFWVLTSQQARFMVPCFYLLMLLANRSVAKLEGVAWKGTVILFMVCATASLPWKWIKHHLNSWRPAIGMSRQIDHVYSGTGDGYLEAMAKLYELEQDEKVMLLFEHRGLYVPREHVFGTPFFQQQFFTPPVEDSSVASQDSMVKTWHENGIRYILVGLSMKDPDRQRDFLKRTMTMAEALGKLRERGLLQCTWQKGDFALYKLKKGEPQKHD